MVAAGISWSYNTFVFWASLAAAASVLKSWCRQRVTFACGVVAGNVLVWWVVCPALVGVVPEVVCCRLGGRRVPT